MVAKVLVIDDEQGITEVVEAYLKKENMDVIISNHGQEGYELFLQEEPDLIVLDLMLPGLSGEAICEKVRDHGDTPVLMLTAKTMEEERINGLTLGADDYLTKPFSPKELVLRVKAILRRTGVSERENRQMRSYNEGHLTIDEDEHIVSVAGQSVSVTPNEYDILNLFIRHPDKVLTRGQIIDAAFGYGFEGYERTIDVHIKNLRRKIEEDMKHPSYIVTVYGVGYKFKGIEDKGTVK